MQVQCNFTQYSLIFSLSQRGVLPLFRRKKVREEEDGGTGPAASLSLRKKKRIISHQDIMAASCSAVPLYHCI